ncbi:CBS domain-containing protein [Allokutzneria albata]|uniref:CBS domain-containing protein n=1 Tax=Allokutzneria albata TaxID=211114 RepID=A0A1G9SIQ1_ALLAB|nr:CBS domain-containing protein [Allokutzneria albata]SDM35388.1 CBS domain-containing protein [Allokutzneria albata]
MRVLEIMTSPAVCVAPGVTLLCAAKVLSRKGIAAAPVVGDAGSIVGIVSEGDIVRGRLVPGPRRPHTVAEVMTGNVLTTRADADVDDLATAMLGKGLRSVPVVSDRGEVLGMVSRRDVMRALARDGNRIASQVRYLLDGYWGPERPWDIEVDGAVVTVAGEFRDESEREMVRRLADVIPGVAVVLTRGRGAFSVCD